VTVLEGDAMEAQAAVIAIPTDADDTADARTAARRARFREALERVAERTSSDDLIKWALVPGSIALVVGFVLMILGWLGAARTFREIEQIPYLISGGLIGLALVFIGGLLLASTLWVVLLRKLHDEAEERATARLMVLEERVAALAAEHAEPPTPAPRKRTRPLSSK
jgi:hypothetical protein